MKKLLNTLFNHERYQSVSVIVVGSLLIWFYGCESSVESIVTPEKKVTRAELRIEIESLIAMTDLRRIDLDKQDEIKSLLLKNALLIASGGAVNPVGVVTALAAVLGIGAAADNVRKRKEIKKLNGK